MFPPIPHRVGGNGKLNQQSTNSDKKLIETVFSIAIENIVSIDFLSTFFGSIGVFDCRLPGVNTVMLYILVWSIIFCKTKGHNSGVTVPV